MKQKSRIDAVMLQPYPNGKFTVKVWRSVPFTSVEGHIGRLQIAENTYSSSIKEESRLRKLIKNYAKLNELNAYRLIETVKKENERK